VRGAEAAGGHAGQCWEWELAFRLGKAAEQCTKGKDMYVGAGDAVTVGTRAHGFASCISRFVRYAPLD
jgi:hypothetical protein